MTKTSIYRSPEGEAEVMALYESKLALLADACESRMVSTRFGPTHVLVAGPAGAPPLLILSGVHAGAPRMLEFFLPLTQEYRVYAPDTIGQPGRSAPTRPAPKNHNYGKWLIDVLDSLGLEKTALVGVSFGGGILLDAAALAPDRISQAVLVVPVGLASASTLKLYYQLFIPWLVYKFFPSRGRLMRAVRPLTEINEDILAFFDKTIRNVDWQVTPPGPFTQDELQRFTAPTLVLLAKEDHFIPVDQAIPQAQKIIANLVAIEVFEGPHIPGKKLSLHLNKRILKFLKEAQ